MTTKKRLAAVVVVLGVCALLTLCGCSSSSSSSQSAAEESELGTITVCVKAPEGAPASKVAVILEQAGGVHKVTQATINGTCATFEVEPGTWVVKLSGLPTTTDGKAVFASVAGHPLVLEGTSATTSFTLEYAADYTAGEAVVDNSEDALTEDTDTEATTDEGGTASSTSSTASGSSNTSSGGTPASTDQSSSSASSGGSNTSTDTTPTHEHNWVWVSNVVTITDTEAYDEPVYGWVDWCPVCNCQVSAEHGGEMMLKGEDNHTLTEKRVITGYTHHDAVTHTEDHGYYQCSTCGLTK